MATGNNYQDDNRNKQEGKGNDRSRFFIYLIILALIVLILILLFRTCDKDSYEPVRAPAASAATTTPAPTQQEPLPQPGREPEAAVEFRQQAEEPEPGRELDVTVDMPQQAEEPKKELDVDVDMGEEPKKELDVDVDMGEEPQKELDVDVDMGEEPKKELDVDVDMGEEPKKELDVDVDMGEEPQKELDVDVDMGEEPKKELDVDVDMGEEPKKELDVDVDMGEEPLKELDVDVDMGEEPEKELDVDVDMGEEPKKELDVDVDMGEEAEKEIYVDVDMGEEPKKELDVNVDMGEEPQKELDVDVDMGEEPRRELEVDVDMGEPEPEPERELEVIVKMGEVKVRIKNPAWFPAFERDPDEGQLQLDIELDGLEIRELPTDSEEPWRVREFIFYGSDILRYDELQDIADECLSKRDDKQVILDVVARVNALYREKDRPGASVAIPSQDITDGVVMIELDDGPDAIVEEEIEEEAPPVKKPEAKPEKKEEKKPEPEPEEEPEEKPAEKPVEEEQPELEYEEQPFRVIEIRFSESQVFEEEELDDIVEESREHHDGMDLLLDVVDRVNDEYEERGYPNAYAYLPEQEVSDGVFFVQLIEGRLGSFTVVDNRYTADTYFLSRFRFDMDKPLDLADFEYQLKKFNMWSSGYAATATIDPGETAGTSDIVLHAVESFPATLSLEVNNFGSEATGKFRFGAHFAYDSVYRQRDILMIGISGNKNSYSPYMDYSVLTPRINLRYGIRGSLGRSTIINGAGSGYDIKEYNENVVVYSNVPVQQSLLSQLVLQGNIGYSHAKSEAMGVVLSDIHLGTAQLGVNFTFAPWNWLFLYTWHNISIGSSFADKNPYIWVDGGLNMSLNVYNELIFKISSKYQVAVNGSPLPGSLLFQTGGATSVRGYAEGCAFGESGAFASGEAHIPLDLLDIYGFIDFAYFRPEPDTGENLIWSWGVGAEGNLGGLVMGVFFGLPQIDITQDPEATKGRVNFYVKLSPDLSVFS